jgi:hypothetical protein
MTNQRERLLALLTRVLTPVARLALRHSLLLPELVECLKQAMLNAASESLQGKRVTASRLSLMSGVHRKDVARLQSGIVKQFYEESLIARIVGHWQGSKHFTNQDGSAKVLSCGFEGCLFNQLVQAVGRELNPATVLFELERTQVVRRSARGVALVKQSYSPSDKFEYGLQLLGDDCADLIEAVSQNLDQSNRIPNLHARTSFDKVRAKDLPEARSWLLREGHALHLKARSYFSALDQDISPEPDYKGPLCKVTLGSFSRISEE